MATPTPTPTPTYTLTPTASLQRPITKSTFELVDPPSLVDLNLISVTRLPRWPQVSAQESLLKGQVFTVPQPSATPITIQQQVVGWCKTSDYHVMTGKVFVV
jgi:hypothetical protein